MKHIHFCAPCKKYTMSERCPKCTSRTNIAKPVKFSPLDKLGKYRRQAKEEERKKRGLL